MQAAQVHFWHWGNVHRLVLRGDERKARGRRKYWQKYRLCRQLLAVATFGEAALCLLNSSTQSIVKRHERWRHLLLCQAMQCVLQRAD